MDNYSVNDIIQKQKDLHIHAFYKAIADSEPTLGAGFISVKTERGGFLTISERNDESNQHPIYLMAAAIDNGKHVYRFPIDYFQYNKLKFKAIEKVSVAL